MRLFAQLRNGIKNPNGVWLRLLQDYFSIRGHEGVTVMNEDWDNLIILDACRYDIFKKIYPNKRNLYKKKSKGSNTKEFITKNFLGGEYLDCVYITANPQINRKNADQCFFNCIDLWKTDWDEEHQTVLPSTVADRTIEIQDSYPNKRLIVHFIQPHYPFIGGTGQNLEHRTITGNGLINENEEVESIWKRLERGEVDKIDVMDAYRENLKIALPHVKRLTKELIGKTVVTSDHGNCFGRLGIYGHPEKCYMSELVNVPWVEIEAAERPEVFCGDSSDINANVNKTDRVRSRLQSLGYIKD